MNEYRITGTEDLRKLIGKTPQVARDKVKRSMDDHAQNFIARSPFLCLATRDPSGGVDVSPRGDMPGFVRITDPQTLYIPDRPGNRRIDSMINLLGDPALALIFFVPGISETLRVHGHAELVAGEILETLRAREITPLIAIKMNVDKVYFHCGKALLRSGLWKDKYRVDRKDFPSFGQILRDQIDSNATVESYDSMVKRDYDESLY